MRGCECDLDFEIFLLKHAVELQKLIEKKYYDAILADLLKTLEGGKDETPQTSVS